VRRDGTKRSNARRAPSESAKVIHLEPRAARVGIAEHFRIGERDRAERVLEDMAALGIRDLRVCVSWADSLTAEGKRFYDWLIPALATRARIVPCITHTPPSLGVEPRSSSPPRDGRVLADWLDVFLTQHGDAFEHVELWNAPSSLAGWDARLDPDLARFAAAIGGAASWARQRGKKTVLGGLRPVDPSFLRKLAEHDVLKHFDAIAIHAYPGLDPSLTDWK
jgi:CDP-paratose 2-epimerase